MGYTHGYTVESPTRICTKCKKELPNTNEYFCYAKKSTGQLSAVCKECKKEIEKQKREATIEKNKNLSLFYEGTKKCKKCGRDLPNDKLHFPVDLSTKTGLRNVCRECDKSYGNFLEDDSIPLRRWTDEETELFISVYAHYTNEEIKEKFFPDRTIKAIVSRADYLGISGKTEEAIKRSHIAQGKKISISQIGRVISNEQRKKQSEFMKEYYKTHKNWAYGKKMPPEVSRRISELNTKLGRWKGKDNPRSKNPLKASMNPNWKGGVTELYTRLRSSETDWFEKSMKFCNYNCVITGNNFDNIHHTTSFKDIVDEAFENIGLDKLTTIGDYNSDQYSTILNQIKLLHIKYGFGACLIEKVHILFHKNYGYKDFTPYDFLDFVKKIESGYFKDWFQENNLKININYDYINYLKSTLLQLE